MPSPRERQEILFYEASEGGAGVLRQLAEAPAVLPALVRRALAICHYDPDTGEDRAADRCGRACCECLLDYGNQPDHRILDRGLIRELLADLARSECRPAGGAGSRAERLAALRKRCDSRLEQHWLDMVESLGLRLPSDAQYAIPGHHTRPDFFYREANAVIYVDGPPHDAPDQAREDEAKTRALIEAGYIVIRFHHGADWRAVFRRHPDVFGEAPSRSVKVLTFQDRRRRLPTCFTRISKLRSGVKIPLRSSSVQVLVAPSEERGQEARARTWVCTPSPR